MSQTAYPLQPDIGFDGGTYDAAFTDTVSAVAAADIPFGRLVVRGAVVGTCALPATPADVTGGNVLGIAIHDSSLEQEDGATQGRYRAAQRVQIRRLGRVRIRFESAVGTGAQLFVRFVGENPGRFRGDADGGNAVALPNARAYQGAGAGGLGIVEINKIGA